MIDFERILYENLTADEHHNLPIDTTASPAQQCAELARWVAGGRGEIAALIDTLADMRENLLPMREKMARHRRNKDVETLDTALNGLENTISDLRWEYSIPEEKKR